MTTYSEWDQRQLDIASGAELDRIAERRACADCGGPDATMEYIDPQSPKDRFLLCKSCFEEWTE